MIVLYITRTKHKRHTTVLAVLAHNRSKLAECATTFQLGLVALSKLIPAFHMGVIPTPQFRTWRDFLQPQVNGSSLTAETSRPQTIDQNAKTIVPFGIIVDTLDAHFASGSRHRLTCFTLSIRATCNGSAQEHWRKPNAKRPMRDNDPTCPICRAKVQRRAAPGQDWMWDAIPYYELLDVARARISECESRSDEEIRCCAVEVVQAHLCKCCSTEPTIVGAIVDEFVRALHDKTKP